jgi:hypothetical protein
MSGAGGFAAGGAGGATLSGGTSGAAGREVDGGSSGSAGANGGSSAGTMVTSVGGEGGEATSAGAAGVSGNAGSANIAGASGNGGGAGSAGSEGMGPDPSPGCELGNAEPETMLEHFDGTRVSLPPGYDGVTPFPMLIGFHETNISNQFTGNAVTMRSIGQSYVLVAPQRRVASPGTFEGQSASKVAPLLDEVLANFCVDRRNLFAAGQGSGGRYLGSVLCASSSTPDVRFRAATIMGAYSGCSTWPPIPLLFVHGVNGSESAPFQDRYGQKALAKFRANSGCSATSAPHPAPTCSSSGTQVTPVCVDFEGCVEPLRHCAHDDPILNNSGWPCFAYVQMYEFFETQRSR